MMLNVRCWFVSFLWHFSMDMVSNRWYFRFGSTLHGKRQPNVCIPCSFRFVSFLSVLALCTKQPISLSNRTKWTLNTYACMLEHDCLSTSSVVVRLRPLLPNVLGRQHHSTDNSEAESANNKSQRKRQKLPPNNNNNNKNGPLTLWAPFPLKK